MHCQTFQPETAATTPTLPLLKDRGSTCSSQPRGPTSPRSSKPSRIDGSRGGAQADRGAARVRAVVRWRMGKWVDAGRAAGGALRGTSTWDRQSRHGNHHRQSRSDDISDLNVGGRDANHGGRPDRITRPATSTGRRRASRPVGDAARVREVDYELRTPAQLEAVTIAAMELMHTEPRGLST